MLKHDRQLIDLFRRRAAQQWSYRQGFSHSQIQDFEHLMKTALSKWIPKRQLVGAVQIDSGSFGRIYQSKYDDLQVAVKEIAQASSSLRSKIKEISYELKVKQNKIDKQTASITLLNTTIRAKDALLAKANSSIEALGKAGGSQMGIALINQKLDILLARGN